MNTFYRLHLNVSLKDCQIWFDVGIIVQICFDKDIMKNIGRDECCHWWRLVRDKTNKAVNTSEMASMFELWGISWSLTVSYIHIGMIKLMSCDIPNRNFACWPFYSAPVLPSRKWRKIVVHGNQSFHAYFACMIIFFNVPDGLVGHEKMSKLFLVSYSENSATRRAALWVIYSSNQKRKT